MNNLMVFENQKVEVFEFNGKVLFNPYDVGRCLELTDSAVRKSIRNFNDNQRIKLTQSIVTNGNNLDIPTAGRVYLTESGVYKLIFKSRKKEAEKFSDWVTDEVLPAIRQTGKYETKPTVTRAKNNISSITYIKKTYNEVPVMVLRDLVSLFGMHKEDLNWIIITNEIEREILEGINLQKFKNENNSLGMKYVSTLGIYTKDSVLKLARILNKPYDRTTVEKYFDSSLSDYEKIWRMELANDIVKLTYGIRENVPYKRMLFMIASKIYMDCGFINQIYDELNHEKLNDISMNIKEFKEHLKQKLL